MAYVYIDPNRYDADSPITESLMEDIIGNVDATRANGFSEVTGSGTYTVPAGITKLKVVLIGGGGGGRGGQVSGAGGAGGASGSVLSEFITTTGGSTISYSCGAGGAGGINAGTGTDGGNTTFGALTAFGGEGSFYADTAPVALKNKNFHLLGGKGSSNGTLNGDDGDIYPSVISGEPGVVHPSYNGGGGGGAPCGLPFALETSSLGDGGDGGGTSPNTGGNASLYGAGGGGGGGTNLGTSDGGNGSAGIIFIQIIS